MTELPKPYYEKDGKVWYTFGMECQCGCGANIADNRRFVSGHNIKLIPRTPEHNRKIGEAQARAWQTKRERLPLGSTIVSVDGYVLVKVLPGKGAWLAQHRLIFEASIGRKLLRSEVVHHVNGDRQDNRLENLYLCENRSHHNKVHASQDKALRICLEMGIVKFQDGEYIVA